MESTPESRADRLRTSGATLTAREYDREYNEPTAEPTPPVLMAVQELMRAYEGLDNEIDLLAKALAFATGRDDPMTETDVEAVPQVSPWGTSELASSIGSTVADAWRAAGRLRRLRQRLEI